MARMTRRRHVRRRRVSAVLRVRHPPLPPLPTGARLFSSTRTLFAGVYTDWLLCDRIPRTGCCRSRPVRRASGRQAAFFLQRCYGFAALALLWGGGQWAFGDVSREACFIGASCPGVGWSCARCAGCRPGPHGCGSVCDCCRWPLRLFLQSCLCAPRSDATGDVYEDTDGH